VISIRVPPETIAPADGNICPIVLGLVAPVQAKPVVSDDSVADRDTESGAAMLHFSCDLCGRNMVADSDRRYVVKMEVFAAHDPAELTEDDFDADHLEEISQLLADDSLDAEPAPAFKELRYDLCPPCHKKFLADPLSRDATKFDFSEN
jgi:hypothetical protein